MAKFFDQESCFPDETDGLAKAIGAAEKLKIINNPYTGNKKKMILDIWKYLVQEEVKFDTVLDLFSGSASVGIFFKYMGSSVVSNDLLTLPYLTSLALVENSSRVFTSSEIEHLFQGSCVKGFVSRNYGASLCEIARFTQEEAGRIDLFYHNLQDIVGPIPSLLQKSYERPIEFNSSNDAHLYKAAFGLVTVINHIMTNCFIGGRLNRGQVLAEINFRIERQKKKSDDDQYDGSMSFTNLFVPDMRFVDPRQCFASRCDAMELFDKDLPHFDLVYIDPPYGGDQSDYAEMYRFVEEYVWQSNLEDIPNISCADRFIKSKTYDEQFRMLLSKLPNKSAWAISYNNDSWSDIVEIKKIVSEFKTNIVVKEIDYEYQYRKHNQSAGIEYLIIAR